MSFQGPQMQLPVDKKTYYLYPVPYCDTYTTLGTI